MKYAVQRSSHNLNQLYYRYRSTFGCSVALPMNRITFLSKSERRTLVLPISAIRRMHPTASGAGLFYDMWLAATRASTKQGTGVGKRLYGQGRSILKWSTSRLSFHYISIGGESRTSSISFRTCQLTVTFGSSRRLLGYALATYHPAGNPTYQKWENKATISYVSSLSLSAGSAKSVLLQLHTFSSVSVPCTTRCSIPHFLRIPTGT
jgi:hypothetical protein